MADRDEGALPKGWRQVCLGDVAAIQSGVTKNSQTKAAGPLVEVPYLRVANVQRGTFDLEEIKTIAVTPEELEALRLQPGDILFNEGGDRDKLGRGWVWGGEIPDCIHQNHVFRARLRSPDILPRFVSWYANSVGQSYFLAHAKQTTNLASINQKILKALPLVLPPRAEQVRIVAEIETQFSRLDAAEARLNRALVNLKRARASVLKAAVEGRLVPTEAELARAEGRTFESASELLLQVVEARRQSSEAQAHRRKYKEPEAIEVAGLTTLPEGWCWASWQQVGFSQNGRPFPSSEYQDTGVKLLRPGNLFADGSVRWNDSNTRYLPTTFASENADLIVRGAELVMNLTAQSLKDDFLGRVCLTGPANECLLNQRLARLTPMLCNPRYFLALFRSPPFRKFVKSLNKGSLIQHMFTSQLDNYAVALPPLAEQHRIVAEVDRRLSVLDRLEARITANLSRCKRLRQAILKRAFEGRLVPQEPT